MKLSVLQENLNQALTVVSRFVAAKSQLPLLGHILFSTDSGRLKLSATNLELGINYWLGAKIDLDGSFTVPDHDIAEFVSYLPAGRLDLSLVDNLLEVVSSKATSTFSTTPSTDFPSLPPINSDTAITLDAKTLSAVIDQITFAAATDDSRPILTAVLCRFTNDILFLVATDGFRLSLKQIKLTTPIILPENSESLTLLIPARSLQEVAKLAKTSQQLSLGVSSDSHQLIFVLEDLELVSRLLEGDYPDYNRIIPESYATKVTLSKEDLSQAVKIASVFARQSANVIKLNIKNSLIEISANAPQIGKNSAKLDAKLEGDPLEIAFNYKFITDFLAICHGSEITIELNDSLTPVRFIDLSDPDFTHIIMPVRIQD